MEEASAPATAMPPEAWKNWLGRLAAGRRRRDDAMGLWQENVRRRASRSGETDSTVVKVNVNKDWPLTKAKMALLYSTTPQIRLTSNIPQALPAIAQFSFDLNHTIKKSSVGAAIEEELADVINASGISAVLLACEKRTEWRDMPMVDPATLPPEMQMEMEVSGIKIPTMPVQAETDIRYLCDRLSPASLIIPADFTGSNYDRARFLAYDGSMTWEQSTINLGLTDDQKDKVVGPDRRASASHGSLNSDGSKFKDTEVVNFTEVFYWRFFYHAEETNFSAIQRLVFVDGLPEPVVNEEYTGQKRLENGQIVGVTRNPIQVLTLTYISDDCLPPSDSTISRHQVNELEDSRSAMVLQRKHSIPIRWFDVTRISPGTRTLLEEGTYQGLVPITGPGDRAIGEVSRSAFPPERFEFDRIISSDITDQWQVGTNQTGGFASGERSAREAGIIERNFQTRIGQERAKVEKHFVAIAEVLGALMALHGKAALPVEALPGLTFAIRVDSTVLLDAQARIDQLMRFLNMTAQSGYINPKPVIEEIAELSGLDPAKVVIDPQPKPPQPVSISVGGPEDISNPLFLATLMRTGQAPGPNDLQAAIQLIQAAMTANVPVLPPIQEGERRQVALPTPTPPPLQFPEWEAAPRLDRRSEDGGA
jgi:hypothetical protein